MPLLIRALPYAAVLLLSLTPLLKAQVTERFLVGVVRDDGLIRPMAAVDKGRWREPWPKAARQVEVPIRVRDVPRSWWGGVPFSETWRLVTDDAAERHITVDGLTWVPSYCQQQVMLTSADAIRETLRPADGMRAPKYGLALMGGGRAERTVSHDEESAVARQIADLVAGDFDANEHRLLLGPYLGQYLHPLSREERARYPIRIIRADQGPGPHGDVYFFEAIRHYPRGEAQPGDEELYWCDTVTFLQGWLYRKGDDELDVSVVGADITSCLLDTVVRREPLGVVRNERGAVWIFEEWLPNGEAYAAYEPPGRRDERLLLQVRAGWCAR